MLSLSFKICKVCGRNNLNANRKHRHIIPFIPRDDFFSICAFIKSMS